ncbi:uncharacterized protein LOC141812961 [Curcuma longa]|uniref:uncharacterized protein LOC141812961 n=1 Tax=Curcuma longa TaxID=136217 RepID=UPI003D9EF69F
MDPKEVAALVSFLVSQIPLLLTLFPFAHPRPSFSTPFSLSAPQSSLLSLSLHLLSSASHIAAISPCRPRKRKRYQQDSEPHAAIALRRRDPDHSLLCFRMKSTTFEWLCGLLDPLLDCRDPAGSSLRLSGPTRLAIALSRLASGAPYLELAARFGVPESTARFCTNIISSWSVLFTNIIGKKKKPKLLLPTQVQE